MKHSLNVHRDAGIRIPIPKLLIRFVGLLLVPCLIGEPAFTVELKTLVLGPRLGHALHPEDMFIEQAIVDPIINEQTPFSPSSRLSEIHQAMKIRVMASLAPSPHASRIYEWWEAGYPLASQKPWWWGQSSEALFRRAQDLAETIEWATAIQSPDPDTLVHEVLNRLFDAWVGITILISKSYGDPIESMRLRVESAMKLAHETMLSAGHSPAWLDEPSPFRQRAIHVLGQVQQHHPVAYRWLIRVFPFVASAEWLGMAHTWHIIAFHINGRWMPIITAEPLPLRELLERLKRLYGATVPDGEYLFIDFVQIDHLNEIIAPGTAIDSYSPLQWRDFQLLLRKYRPGQPRHSEAQHVVAPFLDKRAA